MSSTCFSLLAVILTVNLLLRLVSGLVPDEPPSSTVRNGTYVGKYVPEWQQDQFLGIPYAIPPLGSLRFARPQSLNSSFAETRNATQYGFSCYQYLNSAFYFGPLSEDCLTLNSRIISLVP
jgi:carboxylesterase type B